MCRCAVDTHQIVQSVKSIIEEVVVRKNIRSMIMNNTTPYKKDSLSPPLVIRVRTRIWHNNIFLNILFTYFYKQLC